ncbi:MAG: hypothetical protein M4579_000805 [Chaenotheca gracillima]|nr:MAG: hypothetical protein M4579_000805 [Chaenotheca gracillima]
MEVGDFPLKGKIVVITGGGSGINLSFAKLSVAQGARVVIADLRLTAQAEEFKASAGDQVIFQQCDVTRWSDLSALSGASEDAFGDSPDVWIAGAGVFEPSWSSFWDDTATDHYAELDINVSHPIKLTRLAMQSFMKKGKKGVVLIVASIAGYLPSFPCPVYSASKHAVVGFTRSMAKVDATQGVKIGCVCPGYVRTAAHIPRKVELIRNVENFLADVPVSDSLVDTPLFSDSIEKTKQFGVSRAVALTPDEVAQTMAALVEDGKYPGGTCLEITKLGQRVVAPPQIPPALEIPQTFTERTHAPVLKKLEAERQRLTSS